MLFAQVTSFSGFQTSSWNLLPSRFSSSHLTNQSHASLFLPLSHYISAYFGHYLSRTCFPKPPILPLPSRSCNVSLLVLHNLFSLPLILILSVLVFLYFLFSLACFMACFPATSLRVYIPPPYSLKKLIPLSPHPYQRFCLGNPAVSCCPLNLTLSLSLSGWLSNARIALRAIKNLLELDDSLYELHTQMCLLSRDTFLV